MTKPAILWRFLFSIWLLGLAMVSHITFPCHCLADSAPITRAWKYNTVSLLSKDLTWNAGHDFHAKWKILTENEKKMIRLSSRLTKTSCWMLLRRNGRFNILRKSNFFGPKNFPKKTTQNLLKDRYLFRKRVLFSLHNFARSWQEHG